MSLRGARGPACIAVACLLFLVPAARGMAQGATALTLDQASRLALASSEAIHIRELTVQKSRLGVDEASGKAWPHVDVQVSASYLVNPPTGYTVKAGALGVLPNPFNVPIPQQDFTIGAQLHDYFSASATVSQPLFTWGKIRNAIDAAALQVDSAAADLVAQRRDIQREVHRAFFSALLAEESAKTLRRIANSAAEIVADRQTGLDEGSLTRESVLDAAARRAQLDARLAEAVQSRSTALESLGILTGLDPAGIELAGGFTERLPPTDEEALRAHARDASTDLAASRTHQALAQKKLAIETGGSILRPDVSLGVSLGVTGQEDLPYAGWDWNNSAWNWDLVLSLGVKMSAFDGMESAARIGQARKDAEMAGLAVLQAEKLSRMAVRTALEAATRADADLVQKRAQEEYAAERLKNARLSADSGMSSREELHSAEILFGAAELDRLLAQFTREEALADISRLTGDTP